MCFYDVAVRYSQIDEDDRYTNNSVSGFVESVPGFFRHIDFNNYIHMRSMVLPFHYEARSESAATTTAINIAHDDYIIVH